MRSHHDLEGDCVPLMSGVLVLWSSWLRVVIARGDHDMSRLRQTCKVMLYHDSRRPLGITHTFTGGMLRDTA